MPEQNVPLKIELLSVCHSATACSAYGSYGIVTCTVIWKLGFRVWCSLQLIVHAPVTPPALSGMLLTAITVNGTQVCGVRGLSTVRAPVTSPALFGMLLTAITVNGNTSLRCQRRVYRTCHSHCPNIVFGAYGYRETEPYSNSIQRGVNLTLESETLALL